MSAEIRIQNVYKHYEEILSEGEVENWRNCERRNKETKIQISSNAPGESARNNGCTYILIITCFRWSDRVAGILHLTDSQREIFVAMKRQGLI